MIHRKQETNQYFGDRSLRKKPLIYPKIQYKMEDVIKMLAKKTGNAVNTSVNRKEINSKLRHLC